MLRSRRRSGEQPPEREGTSKKSVRLLVDEKEQFKGESVMGSVRDEDARASGSQAGASKTNGS